MRWLIRITVSLLLLALIGVGDQILGMMTDQEQYLQPRELVDIGAYELHLSHTGKRSYWRLSRIRTYGWSKYTKQSDAALTAVRRIATLRSSSSAENTLIIPANNPPALKAIQARNDK